MEILSLQVMRSVRAETMTETAHHLELAVDAIDEPQVRQLEVEGERHAMPLYTIARTSAQLAIEGLELALNTQLDDSRSCFAVVQGLEGLVSADQESVDPGGAVDGGRRQWHVAPRTFGGYSTPKCTLARSGTGIPSRFAMERTILPQSVSASCPKA